MKLKKIRLENIRSYVSQEIEFPEGSVLLSGDIGSGKSTVLLGIDFALFGLRRGSLSGNSLLRTGEKKGSVELFFEVDSKEVIIKRGLKRGENAVQDSGYVIIDGIKKQGTAIELKKAILDLLNYPKELLTKSKSLIFRYTVYTPQEEMKTILLGDKDLRLDTLRKVFDLDKYKVIRENCEKFNSKLREKRKEFLGFVSDLDSKEKEKIEKEGRINELKLKINELLPGLEIVSNDLKIKKEEIVVFEEKINRNNLLKKDLEVSEVNLVSKKENIERNKVELGNLEKSITEFKILEVEDVGSKIADVDSKLVKIDSEMREINDKLSGFRVKKESSESIKKDILELDVCSLCKQSVSSEHKGRIGRVEDGRLEKLKEMEEIYLKRKDEFVKEISELNSLMEEFREKDKKNSLIELERKNLEEKKNRKEEVLEVNSILSKEIEEINKRKVEIEEELKNFEGIDESYRKVKEEIENLTEKEKKIEIEKGSFESEVRSLEEFLGNLIKELNEKRKVKEEIGFLNEINLWLDKMFLNLMMVMEKKIMLKVYGDFNDLFKKWFRILVEDENLKIELDEEFTPKIEQNGYEIEYGFLSGGEKTAAALAYRLSLNQVINNLMSEVKTRDLLILDEPTDGFSEEQLERVRVVLEELDLEQVIIVSHESKVESFVDEIIRFEKEEGVSRVA
tara:strand:+ start:10 stop:2049 length:2040 start_codon:yes stop_codon:yes gene_type:complete